MYNNGMYGTPQPGFGGSAGYPQQNFSQPGLMEFPGSQPSFGGSPQPSFGGSPQPSFGGSPQPGFGSSAGFGQPNMMSQPHMMQPSFSQPGYPQMGGPMGQQPGFGQPGFGGQHQSCPTGMMPQQGMMQQGMMQQGMMQQGMMQQGMMQPGMQQQGMMMQQQGMMQPGMQQGMTQEGMTQALQGMQANGVLAQPAGFHPADLFFKKFDKDGNGFLDKEELQAPIEAVCRKTGFPFPTSLAVMAVFRALDTDKSGTLDMWEFREICNKLAGTAAGQAVCGAITSAGGGHFVEGFTGSEGGKKKKDKKKKKKKKDKSRSVGDDSDSDYTYGSD